MELNIAIVEDQEPDRERLRSGVQSWGAGRPGALGSLLCYPGGEAMLSAFDPGEVHLVFMDICMEGLDGIETARRLRALDPRLLIVFLTSSREFAFDAFPLHPFDYVVKPYRPQRLHEVLDEALRVLAAEDPAVTLRAGRMEYRVPLRQIATAVSQGHSVEVRLTDGRRLLCAMNFREAEILLGADHRFLVCNRGVMVNMDQASSLEEGVLVMKDGSRWPLRVRDRAKVIADFTQYQIARMRKGAAG